MNIKLPKNYSIRNDETNSFMLVENKNGRDRVLGYYTSLESAIQGFIKRETMKSEASSIKTLLDFLQRLKQSINRSLQPLNLRIVPEIKVGNRKKEDSGK